MTAEGAEIETTDGGGDINLISGSEMNINSANIQSIAPITIDAGQQLNSDGASIVATDGGSNVEISSGADALLSGANVESGSDVEIFSGADILLSGANVGGVNIRLDSSGSMNLNMSTLDVVASWADLSADLQGNADLFVENAEFTAAGQPATLDYKPISVNVIGEPAIGDTSGVGGGPP
ncbi:MAG: hypothetical protein U5K70_06175 [Halodesulfurarchaeum sp.]|nr:hypothetical protein [Halodesulfurarchaeum sp.]